MAIDQDEEIEDADLDTEDNSEEGEEDEEEEGSSEKDEDDSEEDEDEDKSDSNDDDDRPVTLATLKKVLPELLKDRSRNRSAADKRNSGKNRDTKRTPRDLNGERLSKVEETQQQILQLESKRQFGHENNLTPGEVDVVYRFKKNPSAKTLRDPIVKGALEGYRQDQRVKDNIPGVRARPNRASQKEEKNMTPAERSSRFSDRRREILAGKGR